MFTQLTLYDDYIQAGSLNIASGGALLYIL